MGEHVVRLLSLDPSSQATSLDEWRQAFASVLPESVVEGLADARSASLNTARRAGRCTSKRRYGMVLPSELIETNGELQRSERPLDDREVCSQMRDALHQGKTRKTGRCGARSASRGPVSQRPPCENTAPPACKKLLPRAGTLCFEMMLEDDDYGCVVA